MAYRNKTKFYRLPSMANGDVLTEEQQWIKDSTIDNLLYAATFGCDKCLLEQGQYKVHNNHGNYHLTIEPLEENGFALMGIINYRMFYSKNILSTGKLYKYTTYYIYAEYRNEMETNPEYFNLKYYTEKQENTLNNILLCVIYIDDDNIEINQDVNKVYAKNILSHTKDTTNPHGQQLVQDKLYVINNLKLNGSDVTASEYGSYITQKQDYIVQFSKNKTVLFVTAYPESLEAGNISWKIKNNKIIFNNSGDAGIKVNFKLDIR